MVDLWTGLTLNRNGLLIQSPGSVNQILPTIITLNDCSIVTMKMPFQGLFDVVRRISRNASQPIDFTNSVARSNQAAIA
jgi:hypothetical protein